VAHDDDVGVVVRSVITTQKEPEDPLIPSRARHGVPHGQLDMREALKIPHAHLQRSPPSQSAREGTSGARTADLALPAEGETAQTRAQNARLLAGAKGPSLGVCPWVTGGSDGAPVPDNEHLYCEFSGWV